MTTAIIIFFIKKTLGLFGTLTMDNATWHRRKATHWHRWQATKVLATIFARLKSYRTNLAYNQSALVQ
jgi:hypothetical protein